MVPETIVAVSSPLGMGVGIRGIVRLSGAGAHRLAAAVTDLSTTMERGWCGEVSLRLLAAGNRLASVLLFAAPRSFTGEDVAEIHLPDSPALVGAVVAGILDAGRVAGLAVRPANPGEFSARAFFNGKIDLTEAEGIAATIQAANDVELRAAASLREGDLHRETDGIAEEIANLLALVEAEIDFSDEEAVRFIDPLVLAGKLDKMGTGLHSLLESCTRLERLDSPPTVVFVGQPNVGKSSLVNALAQTERSIVSPVAGTTRDMLSLLLHSPRGDILLVDVPGEEPPVDELREKMMAARQRALLDADLVVEVIAGDGRALSSIAESTAYPARCVTVQNKADLLPPDLVTVIGRYESGEEYVARGEWQLVSAKTGFHVAELRNVLPEIVFARKSVGSGTLALNQRHRAALNETKHILDRQFFSRGRFRQCAALSRTPGRGIAAGVGFAGPDHRRDFAR